MLPAQNYCRRCISATLFCLHSHTRARHKQCIFFIYPGLYAGQTKREYCIFERNFFRTMKYPVTVLFALALSLTAAAQQTYTDSLNAFRTKYTEDLYPIIKQDTAHIHFYALQPAFRVKAKVTLLQDQPVFQLATSSGKIKEAKQYALLSFTLKGKACKLYAYQILSLLNKEETAKHLFLPFTDLSSGKESYGGGRYIDLELDDIAADKTVTIDFNKAYNPYCAFTTGYNCPIPPRENYLPVMIKAGERYEADKFEH